MKEHHQHIEEVLKRLQEYGMRVKREKCCFCVEYLGHLIDARGVHTTDAMVQTILNAPSPKNLPQVRSFLGMISYYASQVYPSSTHSMCCSGQITSGAGLQSANKPSDRLNHFSLKPQFWHTMTLIGPSS